MNRKLLIPPLLSLLLILLIPRTCAAQNFSVVRGRILDQSKHTPITGATVSIKNAGLETSTDSTGFFLINQLFPGQYELQVSKAEYSPGLRIFTVNEGDTVSLSVELISRGSPPPESALTGRAPTVLRMDPMAASTVVTKETIRNSGAATFTQFLQMYGPSLIDPLQRRLLFDSFLDGVFIELSFSIIDRFINLRDVNRLVIYRRIYAPIQYSGGAADWIVLIYTR